MDASALSPAFTFSPHCSSQPPKGDDLPKPTRRNTLCTSLNYHPPAPQHYYSADGCCGSLDDTQVVGADSLPEDNDSDAVASNNTTQVFVNAGLSSDNAPNAPTAQEFNYTELVNRVTQAVNSTDDSTADPNNSSVKVFVLNFFFPTNPNSQVKES